MQLFDNHHTVFTAALTNTSSSAKISEISCLQLCCIVSATVSTGEGVPERRWSARYCLKCLVTLLLLLMEYTAEYLEKSYLTKSMYSSPLVDRTLFGPQTPRKTWPPCVSAHILVILVIGSLRPLPSSIIGTRAARPLRLRHVSWPLPIEIPCEHVQKSSGIR